MTGGPSRHLVPCLEGERRYVVRERAVRLGNLGGLASVLVGAVVVLNAVSALGTWHLYRLAEDLLDRAIAPDEPRVGISRGTDLYGALSTRDHDAHPPADHDGGRGGRGRRVVVAGHGHRGGAVRGPAPARHRLDRWWLVLPGGRPALRTLETVESVLTAGAAAAVIVLIRRISRWQTTRTGRPVGS